VSVFDIDVGLRVLAQLAENEPVDEAIEVVLEFSGFMRAVDNPAVVGRIGVGLRTKLEAEVLDDVCKSVRRNLAGLK
jgi:hypothetical protein